MFYILKKNNFKFEEYLFFLLPFAIISGPLIAEFVINIISIKFLIHCYKKKDYSYFQHEIIKILIAFYLITILSAMVSFADNSYEANSLYKNIFYFRFILFGIAIFWLIKNNKKVIEYFFYTLLISFLILFIGEIYEYFFKLTCTTYDKNGHYVIIPNFLICNEKFLIGNLLRPDRLSSFFGDELILGSYFSRLLPLLLYLVMIIPKFNKNFIFHTIILFLTTLSVFLSGERVSFFYTILICFIYFIFCSIKLKNKLLFILLFFLSFFILLSTNSVIKERMFIQTLNQIKSSDEQKFYYFSKQHHAHAEAAIKMYFEKPIFGVGPKNFRKVCPNKIYSSKFACTSHPHNTFLQVLGETGLLGSLIPLFLLISIIIYYCKNLFKLFSKKKYEIHLPKIILIGCFFITLFPFLPSGNFFTNHLNIIFYLPLGFFMYEFDRFLKK